MTESEFHTKRQMFAAKNGHIVIAPQGYPYSHFEWFCGLFGLESAREWQKRATRGYVLDGVLVAYIDEFQAVGISVPDLVTVVTIFKALRPEGITEVGVGAIPSGEQPWLAKNQQSVEDFLERARGHVERQCSKSSTSTAP